MGDGVIECMTDVKVKLKTHSVDTMQRSYYETAARVKTASWSKDCSKGVAAYTTS